MVKLHQMTWIIYFICLTIVQSLLQKPATTAISLAALCIFILCGGKHIDVKSMMWIILLFLLYVFVTPLYNHNGETVLFMLNGKRITKEAVCTGLASGSSLAVTVCWCMVLSKYITSEGVIEIFSKISKKAALILSMTLKLIPEYVKQGRLIRESQKLSGLYGEGTILERIRAEAYIFSGVMNWALEHSMETADSIRARGYGAKNAHKPSKTYKQKTYKQRKFRNEDIILNMIIPMASVMCIVSAALGASVAGIGETGMSWPSEIFFAIMTFSVPFYMIVENLRWKYLRYRI